MFSIILEAERSKQKNHHLKLASLDDDNTEDETSEPFDAGIEFDGDGDLPKETVGHPQVQAAIPQQQQERKTSKTLYTVNWGHYKNGKIVLLPEGYNFLHTTFEAMIQHWYCRDPSRGTPSYRYLKGTDVKDIN